MRFGGYRIVVAPQANITSDSAKLGSIGTQGLSCFMRRALYRTMLDAPFLVYRVETSASSMNFAGTRSIPSKST